MSLLSVVIPSFNEELNILHTAETVARVLEDNHIDYEIIFVDDGSKDDTYNKIREAGAKNPKVRGAKFSRNFGKESCIFAGLSLATGDCCVVMDCDLQHPADVVPRMYKLWKEGYDVIEGVKKSRGKESIAHKMSAGLFYKLISRCSGIDMERSSDFKLLDRKVVDTLLTLQERNTFFRALSFWVGFRAITIEFEVAEREFGTTKWSIKSLAKYAINNVTSFSALPLYLITGLGGIFILCSLVLGIQTLVMYLLGKAVAGFTTVILLLLIVGGTIMVSLGIIGYYIAKIYDEIKCRPRYIISDEVNGKKDGSR